MKLSRRGAVLGALSLGACAPVAKMSEPVSLATTPNASVSPRRLALATQPLMTPPLDVARKVRPELMSRAMAALDIHSSRIPNRDRMYLVDFSRHSAEERLYEVDLVGGLVHAFRTSHGKGSDPAHTGYARDFSNTMDSHMSSVGSFVSAGAGWGPEQGPNVLLDGLEYTNNAARERAIIVHGADYAEPSVVEQQGKLGRSYGCFSTAHADLHTLRDRMGEGRLLFAWA